MNAFVKMPMQICDAHIHVGKFSDGMYFSPEFIIEKIKALGLHKFAVSSTSSIDGDFSIVRKEIKKIVDVYSTSAIPLLWVIPSMLDNLSDYLADSEISFKGFKLHPFANQWQQDDQRLTSVFSLAHDMNFPIVMHTGWTPESEANKFFNLYRRYPEVKSILAHGRPIDQAIQVASECKNVYIDLSYMPVKDIYMFLNACGPERILFGTDFPLDRYYYPNASIVGRYKRRVNTLVECFGEKLFHKWCYTNFEKVFENKI